MAAQPTAGRSPRGLPVELQPDEHVVLLCRRHWLQVYPKLAAYVLVALVPVTLLIGIVGATADFEGAARALTLIASALWVGYWAVRGYFTWYRYQNDVWVITNQRLIDSPRRYWFHRQVASTDLVDIEDVAVQREGVLHTAFNFGDLRCQTAGE